MHVYEYLCNALMIFRVSSVFKIVRYIFVKAPKRCTGLLDKSKTSLNIEVTAPFRNIYGVQVKLFLNVAL